MIVLTDPDSVNSSLPVRAVASELHACSNSSNT